MNISTYNLFTENAVHPCNMANFKNRLAIYTLDDLMKAPKWYWYCDYKCTGVYCITCLINNKKYIGKSIDINQRINNHKSCLQSSKHKNIELQNDYNLYSLSNFTFEILEVCLKTKLDELEEKHPLKYDINKLYSNVYKLVSIPIHKYKQTLDFIDTL